ncbi:MAG: hypothetical protein AAF969_03950 [Bacteroidota bacterium]
MNTKLNRLILAICLLLSIMGCHTAGNKMQREPRHFSDGKELVQQLDRLFLQLAQIDPTPSESKPLITSINEQIRKTIEGATTQSLLIDAYESYNYKTHEFGFILSEDQQLAVFSWDTRRDGANKFKNIAFHIKGHKAIPTSLYGESIIYHEAYTIQNSKNRSFYIIHGKGKTQEGHDFYRLDALSITPDGLSEAPIFPNQQSSMLSARPLDSDSRTSADFSIEMDGSLILKPEFWNPAVVYRPLELINDQAGTRFLEGSLTLKHPLNPKDFASKNKDNFINGSEIPLKTLKSPNLTFIFDDQIKITLVHEKDRDTTLLQTSIYGADLVDIELHNHVDLIGKKGDLLFLMEKEEYHKVILYDLSQKRMRWSKRMENLLISDDKLVFTEPIEAYQVSKKANMDCKMGAGVQQTYYKVYAFDYDVPNPIVEYTQQILCGYRENQSLAKL